MFKRIDHIEITTTELDKTLTFYRDVIGFKFKSRLKMERPPLEEIVYLTLGDTMLELLSVKEAASVSTAPWQTGYRMMALEVDNMEKTVAYLAGKGIQLSRPPIVTENSLRAEIKDPNGVSIELRQW